MLFSVLLFLYRKIPSKRNDNSGNVKSVDENVLFYQQILIYLDWILYLDRKSPRVKTLQKEIFVRIKRNSWRIEKSNGFHSTSHLRKPVLSSLASLPNVLLLYTFDELIVKRFPIKRPSCCWWHIEKRYKERRAENEVK